MKIDWSAGYWTVWDMRGNQLAKVRQLHVRVPSQLVTDKDSERKGGYHGWLVVSGMLRVDGDIGFIE